MYTTTDLVVLLLLIFFTYRGWRKGLLRSLIGPVSLVICGMIAMIHYDLNKNLVTSLTIAIIGSVVLSIVAMIVLSLMRLTVDKEYRDYIFWGSRLLGSIFNLIWKGAIISSILLSLAMLPTHIFGLHKLHTDVVESVSYSVAHRLISKIKPAKEAAETLDLLNDSHYLDKLSSTDEYEKLMKDEKIQELRNDPEVAEMMDNKDIAGLMSNPKIIELLQDDEFMLKINELSRKAYQQKQEEEAAEEERLNDPFIEE